MLQQRRGHQGHDNIPPEIKFLINIQVLIDKTNLQCESLTTQLSPSNEFLNTFFQQERLLAFSRKRSSCSLSRSTRPGTNKVDFPQNVLCMIR